MRPLITGMAISLLTPAAYASSISLNDNTWTATGAAGIINGDSTVPNSPTGNSQFGYVTTSGGVTGVSSLQLKR